MIALSLLYSFWVNTYWGIRTSYLCSSPPFLPPIFYKTSIKNHIFKQLCLVAVLQFAIWWRLARKDFSNERLFYFLLTRFGHFFPSFYTFKLSNNEMINNLRMSVRPKWVEKFRYVTKVILLLGVRIQLTTIRNVLYKLLLETKRERNKIQHF